MILFTLHNYLVFIPLCILGFFIIIFYIKKNKENKMPLDYLDESVKEEYKEEVKEVYQRHKVVLNDNIIIYKETIRPKDFNDKQKMTKYNKNTYRNSKGRYVSLTLKK